MRALPVMIVDAPSGKRAHAVVRNRDAVPALPKYTSALHVRGVPNWLS